jgi:glycerol-3-phosphate dehydrogenase (NAD(P)+)
MSENLENSIAILGTGAWANTLAFLLGQNHYVVLWDHDAQRARRTIKTRRFKKPITQKYPDNVKITGELTDVLNCQVIINAVSLKGMAEVFGKLCLLKPSEKIIFLNAAKGIDAENLKTPSEIIRTFCEKNPISVISGPNLAKELIKGKPMVTEIACEDKEIAAFLQSEFNNPSLRIYINDDVKGVELCGALKNVMAIAAGASDSLGLGESAKASLVTRGLNEIGQFLKFYNCQEKTLLGPAGIGDLVATCSSQLSRNYRVGYFLAEGKKLSDIQRRLGEVAEGVNTANAVHKIIEENNLNMPICSEVFKVINGESSAVDAVLSLMKRPVSK